MIDLYSRKFIDAQKRYIETEKELLIIFETLKQFRTILSGQILIIYTEYKNPTWKV